MSTSVTVHKLNRSMLILVTNVRRSFVVHVCDIVVPSCLALKAVYLPQYHPLRGVILSVYYYSTQEPEQNT